MSADIVLIADSETGFLFPAGSTGGLAAALEQTPKNRDHWGEVRMRARRFVVEQRSWKQSIAGYAPMYERLTAARPVPALARMGG